jgi:FKBP-type peptidyl-prolyl cis-trans isomerase SlyD
MRVAHETVVSIDYTLKDEKGNVLDTSQGTGPMEYLHGAKNIIPGLEQGIEGLVAGDAKSVVVPPALGYGEYNEKLIQRVPLDRLNQYRHARFSDSPCRRQRGRPRRQSRARWQNSLL